MRMDEARKLLDELQTESDRRRGGSGETKNVTLPNDGGHGVSISIRDIGEVFDTDAWLRRVHENPNRIYGFIICADEHTEFIEFVEVAWSTHNALSNDACDIFTFERPKSDARYTLSKTAKLLGVSSHTILRWIQKNKVDVLKKIDHQGHYCFSDEDVAKLGNALQKKVPLQRSRNRTQCFDVVKKLFESPHEIILPGFAVFPSANARKAAYFDFSTLNSSQFSGRLQRILWLVQEAYDRGGDADAVFEHFRKIEEKRCLKQRFKTALLKFPLKDFVKLFIEKLWII